MKRILIFGTLLLSIIGKGFADEGMWLPLLLADKQIDMQKNGMKITAEDIYSANHSSLKDAVVLFGRGCTGEFVSSEGLLLTNHHCGYGSIVSLSTVEADYLTNGFWAQNKESELPCKGMTVTSLVYMEDVTKQVLQGVDAKMTESDREKIINENIEKIKAKAIEGTHYQAVIKPFYYGNQYFMYVNEVFKDVRLVGAPPSNIGKFGGDTDNWMWPRHTGDFSMFRVYVGKDNKPADYSPENVPYVPKKHLKINLNGVKEGDFTFVFGYPGTTKQFLISDAVDFVQNLEDPIRIKLRTIRLDVYNRAMNSSPAQRLRYASQVASIANGWKKWQGEVRGLKRLNTIEKKKDFEKRYSDWAASSEETNKVYGSVLPAMKSVYSKKMASEIMYVYLNEAIFASDLMLNARNLLDLITEADKETDEKVLKMIAEGMYGKFSKYYENDYENHRKVDKEIFVKTMTTFYDACVGNLILEKKFDGPMETYFESVYETSLLSNPDKAKKLLGNFKSKNIKKIAEDPAVKLLSPFWDLYVNSMRDELIASNNELDSLYRVYVAGIMQMEKDKDFYPDANLTLRVAYGKVKSYEPKDGIVYKPYSTIEGIMEKENPDVYDYVVVDKLKELYNTKDYGPYANEKGEMPVAFIASNHTTGGNSGSPVLDANGDLIGINFDRNWEGTMSDIMYDPTQCRNISLDIRYCLFIIDKFAGAKHLVDEMTIVK